MAQQYQNGWGRTLLRWRSNDAGSTPGTVEETSIKDDRRALRSRRYATVGSLPDESHVELDTGQSRSVFYLGQTCVADAHDAGEVCS